MSITPPTPAEVAEARAWFREDPDVTLEQLDYGDAPAAQYAAVLVRAALAAPAEQPCVREGLTPDIDGGTDTLIVDCSVHGEIGRIPADRLTHDELLSLAMLLLAQHVAARPASPSAVPAVSDGGAGRDLTAQDVQDAFLAAQDEPQMSYSGVADDLNAIARPADTGTQATEQTTEPDGYPYVVALRMDDGSPGDLWNAVTYPTVESAAKVARAAGRSVYELTEVPVSPWSPVAVHDENGAQA